MTSSQSDNISDNPPTKQKSQKRAKKKFSNIKNNSYTSPKSNNNNHEIDDQISSMNDISSSESDRENGNSQVSKIRIRKNCKSLQSVKRNKAQRQTNNTKIVGGLPTNTKRYKKTQKSKNINLSKQIKDKIKPNDCYKPKRQGNPFNILKLLYKQMAHIKPVQISYIKNKYIKFIKNITQSKFLKQIHRLYKNHYIGYHYNTNQQQQQNKIILVQKGLNFITARTVRKQKLEKQKNVLKFHENGNNLWGDNKNIMGFPPNVIEQNRPKMYDKQMIKNVKQAQKMKLLINSNAFASSQYLNQLNKALQKDRSIKYQIKQINSNLTFFWKADQKIIDCFVHFLHGFQQDLSYIKSAIEQQKQYKPTIFILLAQFPNHYQLLNSMRQTKDQSKLVTLQSFLQKARIHGINIWRAHDQQDTLIQLKKITTLLSKKIISGAQRKQFVYHFGSLEKFNLGVKNSKRYNLRYLTGKFFEQIPNIGGNSVKKIMGKQYTLRGVYSKLEELIPKQQMIFMERLLGVDESNSQTNKIIIDLLFLEDYSDYHCYHSQEELQCIGTENDGNSQTENQINPNANNNIERINVIDDDDDNIRKNNNKKVIRQKKYLQDKLNKKIDKDPPSDLEKIKEEYNIKPVPKIQQNSMKTNICREHDKYQYRQQKLQQQQQSEQMYEYESDQQYITKN